MKQELKSAFFSVNFLLGFILTLISLLGMSVPEWIVSADWGNEFRQSALQQSVMGVFFGGTMLMIPFCAAVPYAVRQVEEMRSSMMQWKLLRSSVRQYAARKIIASALSGGGAIALAFILHAVLWNLIAYPCDIAAHPYHEIGFDPECLYAVWYQTMYGLPMYLSMSVGMFFCGGVWTVVALAVAAVIQDKLLTVSIPACIYYLLSASVFRTLFGIRLPHPAVLYNDMLTVQTGLQALAEYAVILALAVFVYGTALRKRGTNA